MENKSALFQTLPGIEKPVSRIFFGTGSPAFMMGKKECLDMLDAVRASGVNTLDMARRYMNAEKVVGEWLASRNCRKEMVLLSKCGHPDFFGKKRVTEKDMKKDLKKTLDVLHTDYIDIYLLHRDDTNVDVGTAVEIFNAMYAEGRIKSFGGSNWSHERIEQANEYAYKHNLVPFTVSSPNFGLAYQCDDPWGGGITISGAQNVKAREWYSKNSVAVVAYSAMCRGFFSGRIKSSAPEDAAKHIDAAAVKSYASAENFERLRRCEELAEKKNATVAQIALRWIYEQDFNSFAVVSTTKPARLAENTAALSIEMTKQEAQYLDLCRNDY